MRADRFFVVFLAPRPGTRAGTRCAPRGPREVKILTRYSKVHCTSSTDPSFSHLSARSERRMHAPEVKVLHSAVSETSTCSGAR